MRDVQVRAALHLTPQLQQRTIQLVFSAEQGCAWSAGSPAHKAGMHVGDILTAINGRPAASIESG